MSDSVKRATILTKVLIALAVVLALIIAAITLHVMPYTRASVNTRFQAALKNEDYEKAFDELHMEKTAFINPKALGAQSGMIYKTYRLRAYDKLFGIFPKHTVAREGIIQDIYVKAPKGTRVFLDGVEITPDNYDNKDEAVRYIENVFVGNHILKTIDANGNVEDSPYAITDRSGLIDINELSGK